MHSLDAAAGVAATSSRPLLCMRLQRGSDRIHFHFDPFPAGNAITWRCSVDDTMHECPGQRNMESQDGNGSYHDNNTLAKRHDQSRGEKVWLLIAEPAREVMSMPRASVHELGDCPKRWFMII